MLPKEERLKNKKDFDKVFKLKHSVATPFLIAYFKKKHTNEDNELPKVGFVVAKKVHKKASKRNKIKRRMREAYRIYKKENLNLIEHFNSIIFIARPAIFGEDYNQVNESIIKCLKKAQRYVKKPSSNSD